MHWHELQKRMTKRGKDHKTAYTLAAFAGGAAVGVTAGLLMAPDKGVTTRTKLAENTRRGWDTGWSKIMAAKDNIRTKMTHIKEEAQTTAKERRRSLTAPKKRQPNTTIPAM